MLCLWNRVATSSARWVLRITGTLDMNMGRFVDLLAFHMPRKSPFRCRLTDGKCITLMPGPEDWLSSRLYYGGIAAYEPETTRVFYALAMRAKVTLDIGAHFGIFTLLAAAANPDGHVYAFEPLPQLARRLEANVLLSSLRNVKCILSAAGDRDGQAALYHDSDTAASMLATLSSTTFSNRAVRSGTDRVNMETSVVPVARLDTFCAQAGLTELDLVKMDTETTEGSVLAGMGKLLEQHKPHIICEVLPGHETGTVIERLLAPYGYHFYLLTPTGPRERPTIDGCQEWWNWLFTRYDATSLAEVLN